MLREVKYLSRVTQLESGSWDLNWDCLTPKFFPGDVEGFREGTEVL